MRCGPRAWWETLGHPPTIADVDWPAYEEGLCIDDVVEIAVQVNGKVRGRVTVPADADSDAVQAAALAEEKVVAFLDGRTPKKVIVVPGRLVNVVL